MYLKKSQKVSNEKHKVVYAVYDDGCLIYDRNKNEVRVLGNVKIIVPNEK